MQTYSPMILQIDKNDSLKTFQQQFNANYPFLKIEFFKKISIDKPSIDLSISLKTNSEKNINEFKNGFVNIDVNRKKTITELEKDFEKLLGLSARVFRKSGNVWVETSITNDWSLEDQNEEGKLISSHFSDKHTK